MVNDLPTSLNRNKEILDEVYLILFVRITFPFFVLFIRQFVC
jgi:hypothetical protein